MTRLDVVTRNTVFVLALAVLCVSAPAIGVAAQEKPAAATVPTASATPVDRAELEKLIGDLERVVSRLQLELVAGGEVTRLRDVVAALQRQAGEAPVGRDSAQPGSRWGFVLLLGAIAGIAWFFVRLWDNAAEKKRMEHEERLALIKLLGSAKAPAEHEAQFKFVNARLSGLVEQLNTLSAHLGATPRS